MFGFFKKRNAGPQIDRSQLVPRIKNKQFLAAAKAAGVPEDQMPVTQRLVGELLIAYAFDLPEVFMMATDKQLAELGIDRPTLLPLAIENLKREMETVSLQEISSFYRVAVGNNLDACALLAMPLWSGQARNMKGKLIASVPHRDMLLFCDSASESGLEEIRAVAAQAYQGDDPHTLTLDLLAWAGDRWQVYRP